MSNLTDELIKIAQKIDKDTTILDTRIPGSVSKLPGYPALIRKLAENLEEGLAEARVTLKQRGFAQETIDDYIHEHESYLLPRNTLIDNACIHFLTTGAFRELSSADRADKAHRLLSWIFKLPSGYMGTFTVSIDGHEIIIPRKDAPNLYTL